MLTGHISFTSTSLDILQDPSLTTFGYQFPAKNTIFSEIHVGSEDISVLSV
jgi:hypothetical protein